MKDPQPPPAAAASAPTVSVACRLRTFKVDRQRIHALATLVCRGLGVDDQDLSINFVGDRTMRRLNREFRHIDKSTDVLSFPQQTWVEPLRVDALRLKRGRSSAPIARVSLPAAVLGDIIISLPDAAANAARIGQALDREVGFLLVHGILHLCGHDHHEPQEDLRMRRAQRSLMRILTTADRGQPLWRRCVRKARPMRRQEH